MEQALKFSFIIPAYNAEKTINNCLDSIETQTYQSFEIIVIDDGSSDDTPNILNKIASENSRLTYKTIKNSGPGEARNNGIRLAKGEYLIFIDVDDYLKEDFLENYVSILEQKNYDLIVSGYRTLVYDDEDVVAEQETTYPLSILNSYDEFLSELYPLMNQQMMYVVWNKVYKRNIIQENNIKFPNYRSCEDRIFNLRYFEYIQNAMINDKINFEYSFDGKRSLTNRYFDNKFDTFVHWNNVLTNIVNEDYEGYASLFLKGVMSCLMSLHSKSCHLSYSEKRTYIKKVLHQNDVMKASKISSNETMMKKVISTLLSIRNVTLNYYSSKVIHLISQASPRVIERIKSSY